MEQIIKQVIGIDCSKDTLDCCFGILNMDLDQKIGSSVRFTNDKTGIDKLIGWSNKQARLGVGICFVVEATGVYHELLAYTLADLGYAISIVLPNKISSFFRTTTIKTITDPIAAKLITQFGLEKKLQPWSKPKQIYVHIKQLTREREQLIEQRTVTKNQLHAEQSQAIILSNSVKRMKKLIAVFDKQISETETELKAALKMDAELNSRIANLVTIPGVALITAATIVGETSGFDLIQSKKQLVSYAGLDVIEKQSGTSINAKKRISRKGNRRLRKCLYFPALTAIRHNEQYKNHFAQLVSKHGIKMKAVVSVQRKLLVLVYSLWKTNMPFDPNHRKESGQQLLATPTELAQGRS